VAAPARPCQEKKWGFLEKPQKLRKTVLTFHAVKLTTQVLVVEPTERVSRRHIIRNALRDTVVGIRSSRLSIDGERFGHTVIFKVINPTGFGHVISYGLGVTRGVQYSTAIPCCQAFFSHFLQTVAAIAGVARLVHAYIVQARVGHVKNFFGNRVSPYVHST
jgi:hypothetical protein